MLPLGRYSNRIRAVSKSAAFGQKDKPEAPPDIGTRDYAAGVFITQNLLGLAGREIIEGQGSGIPIKSDKSTRGIDQFSGDIGKLGQYSRVVDCDLFGDFVLKRGRAVCQGLLVGLVFDLRQ